MSSSKPPTIFVATPKGWPEPAVVISTITAFLVQVFGLVAIFGFNLTDTQQHAVLAAIEPIVGLIFMMGLFIRQFVTPAWKAKALIDAAHVAGQTGQAKPTL